MAHPWSERAREREQGRRWIRRTTGWTAAGALAVTGAFGLLLAHHPDSAAAGTGGTGGGTSYQDGSGQTSDDSGTGGTVINPPIQAPGFSGGRGSVHSGGS